MKKSFSITVWLAATPERVFRAWLSGADHSAMTGSPARVEPRVGGAFSAWDGYITGRTVELKPYSRIVQDWRTTEFPEGETDSRIELVLNADGEGTKLTLIHSDVPDDQAGNYEAGWAEWYFEPMREFFEDERGAKAGHKRQGG